MSYCRTSPFRLIVISFNVPELYKNIEFSSRFVQKIQLLPNNLVGLSACPLFYLRDTLKIPRVFWTKSQVVIVLL